MSNIYFIGLKKDLFWVILDIEEIRDKDKCNRFERGRRNRNVNYNAFHIRDARSPSLCIYLPSSYAVSTASLYFGEERDAIPFL